MSPILLRPIREQFEHSRVIRLLQTRLRRRYLVGVNVGDEREAVGVRSGTGLVHPDLVLTNLAGARRVHGVVEVETAESVNHLEAMAEWVHFGKVRGAFYLYVPAGTTDVARRLCQHHKIAITEIWSYHAVGDQIRFTMTFRSARAASRAAAKRAMKSRTLASKPSGQSAGAAKRAAKSTTKTAKRTATAKKRAPSAAKRTVKTAKSGAGPRSARSVAKKPAAKTVRGSGRTTTRTATSGKRRPSSGGKTSTRARMSAASSAPKTVKRSSGAGTKKTAAVPRGSRKR